MNSKHAILPAAAVALGLSLTAFYTYVWGIPFWSQWLALAIFNTVFYPESVLVVVIGIVFMCYFYCVPLNCWRHSTKFSGKVLARILLVPTSLIALNATWVAPWLTGLLDRIDNGYWELQIIFALIGQAAVCIALIGLVWRISSKESSKRASATVWSAVMIAYFLAGVYILQSHFPMISKILVVTLSTLAITTARLGLRADAKCVDA